MLDTRLHSVVNVRKNLLLRHALQIVEWRGQIRTNLSTVLKDSDLLNMQLF